MKNPMPSETRRQFSVISSGDSIPAADNMNLPASVVYQSRGKLLIVSRCRELTEIVETIPTNLEVFILLAEPCTPVLQRRLSDHEIQWLDKAETIRIEGYLGDFRVEANFRPSRRSERMAADLVLDLLETPILSASVPPVGYFSKLPPGEERVRTIAQLREWVGEFEKPKFFNFDSRLCAHQSAGISGCSACIDYCGAGAVSTESGKIRVNPYLCQGCGDCATVCPSGAIRYNYPPPEITLNKLRKELARIDTHEKKPRVVLFHDGEIETGGFTDPGQSLNANILNFELESPGSAGAEIWLASLAYGASGVLILVPDNLNPETRNSLNGQINYTNEILKAAGLQTAVKLVVRFDEAEAFIENLAELPLAPATFSGMRDKRTVIRLALDFLTEKQESLPEYAELSGGAPFGGIVVDTERCTLCMACVSVCPESALMDGLNEPRLSFIEANCVQCGICKNACPEHAIKLVPRYLFNSLHARKARLLHQDTPFCCIECGKPFATAKVIQNITGKLESHPMFQGNGIQRLLMCDECRVKSFFSTQKPQHPV